MSKVDWSFNPEEYAPVADRITLFYVTYPTGRIVSDLISRESGEVVFRARVYRAVNEPRPAATGWASEKEGDGEINEVACLENTETSAIGRALANLGFTASKKRASYEEMMKADRARSRLNRNDELRSATSVSDDLQALANAVVDAFRLLDAAEENGMPDKEATELREMLHDSAITLPRVAAIERRLRRWVNSASGPAASDVTGLKLAP